MTSHIKAPKACTMTAPKDINVYTDGSLQTPGNHLYSLGGAGVWWPARADQTISDAEVDVAILDKDHPQGLRLLANLTGYGGSSTRMELAAGIIAISADGPAHVGTDSKAFCEKAQYVHQLANERRGPRRPWSLHTDGDLWHIYHQHVVAKGTQAIRITKRTCHGGNGHCRASSPTRQRGQRPSRCGCRSSSSRAWPCQSTIWSTISRPTQGLCDDRCSCPSTSCCNVSSQSRPDGCQGQSTSHRPTGASDQC